jgi:hypothetical protein
MDIPLADEKAEKKFNQILQQTANETYDLMQEVLTEYINELNINELMDKICG